MSDYELKRINALPEASAINDSDVFAIDSAAGTKKVAWETLKGEVDADISEAVSNKADKDGTYPDMAVGSVLGTNTVTDREPYFIRPSASIGDREFDTLVGGSLGWNQLCPTQWKSTKNTDITDTRSYIQLVFRKISSPYTVVLNSAINETGMFASIGKPTFDGGVAVVHNGIATNITLMSDVSVQTNHVYLYSVKVNGCDPTVLNGIDLDNQQVFDLTTLFGSTIADYIYSLETAHAGDGVAWVRKYLPETYYAYCAPTLKHVTGVSAHVMRDANNNVIGNYPIDSTWVGMGIPKLDSDGKLYFDGDRYASDGTVTVKYREITVTADMVGGVGTATTGIKWAYVLISDHPGLDNENARCPKYLVYPNAAPSTSGWIRVTHASIYVFDNALTDLETAKSLLTGLKIVYQLETPTTSSATPFVSPQICDKDGTEEYVTTGLVPVGHETEYVENLADKLTDIPDLPTTAGTYRLKVTVSGGVPSYSWVSA